jgi:hypothetical protein
MRLAEGTLAELIDEGMAFEDAGQYGERFLYGLNFVERSRPVIANEFGEEMTDALFALEWTDCFHRRCGGYLCVGEAIRVPFTRPDVC